jgi:hypothetical protein
VPTPCGVCGQMLVHSQTGNKCKAIQKTSNMCSISKRGVPWTATILKQNILNIVVLALMLGPFKGC